MTPPLVIKMHPTLGMLYYTDVTPGKADRYVAPFYGVQPTTAPTVVTQKGDPGLTAFQVAQQAGFTGTLQQWLDSLKGAGAQGLSAYQVAVAAGFQGTVQQWLDSLKAPSTGNQPGLSAYQVAQQNGFTGTQTEWLASLKSTAAGLSAYQVAQQGGFTGSQADWLASLKSTQPGPASTVPGKSAFEVAQANGFTGTQADWLASLKSTAPSNVAGKSAFDVAVANGFTGTQAQWLASLQGPQGITPKPGVLATAASLLAAGQVLRKGSVVYLLGSVWKVLLPWSGSLGVFNLVGMVDSDGDVIASGNPVKVAGLGYAAGSPYYVEAPAGSGPNTAVLPLPVPASLQMTSLRGFFRVGAAFDRGDGTGVFMDFKFEAGALDGSTPVTFKRLDLTALTYGATPSAGQMRRVIDVSAQATALNKVLADTDSTDTGFPSSPSSVLVNGVLRPGFLQDGGYSADQFHVVTPGDWVAQQAGDYLMSFAVTDGNQTNPGFVFAATASEFWVVRFYGSCNYIAFQHYTFANGSWSHSDFMNGFSFNGSDRSIINLRTNVSGATMKTKAWLYDLTRPLESQVQSEPDFASAAYKATFNASAAFAVGYAGYIVGNGKQRTYALSQSNNPAVPALFQAVS